MNTTQKVSFPEIFTANTHFWSSSSSDSVRRSNEERRQKEVANFLESLGFYIAREGNYVDAIGDFDGIGKVQVTFYYYESCRHVYKSVRVYRNGKKSDVSTIKEIASEFPL